jgi:hypothetical protein
MRFIVCTSLLALILAVAAPASPAEPVEAKEPSRLAVGIGYPDVRARLGLPYGLCLDAKAAFGDGLQAYSGRLAWNVMDLAALKLMTGLEAGGIAFSNVDSLSGSGSIVGFFVGLEYAFSRRFRLSVDVGPYSLHASAEGQSVTSTEVVYNTALYFYLF